MKGVSIYNNRQEWKRLYGLKRWQVLRSNQLAKQPLCKHCKSRFGRITPATVCDHITPHKGDLTLFWNARNLQSLCKPCHDTHKRREETGMIEKPEFGADGYPI